MSYIVRTLDLTNIVIEANKTQLVAPGKRIAEVFALLIPTGATFSLSFGTGGPMFEVGAPFSFEPKGDDMQNDGLYFANDTAQVGVTVQLIIVFAGAEFNTIQP